MKVNDPDLIRRYRVKRHLTQRDLAFLARCSQTTIYLLEKGEMRTLSDDLADLIEKHLDTPPGVLFEARERPVARRMPSVRRGTRSVA